jgi:hypothetical protein
MGRMEHQESAQELLARCNNARAAGTNFPTIWLEMLRRHPLVAGQPVQVAVGSEPLLEIALMTQQSLVFLGGRFYLE